MRGRIRVLATKEAIRPERLEGATAVVVDVFMATSTLLTILENGARRVFVAETPEEVESRCRELAPEVPLRGGEQMARRVDGYDCGPFPAEYPPELVAGRDVVYVSTNGTAAIARAASASRLFLAGLRNAPAVARYLERIGADSIYIVCAGSLGQLALDDFAGAASILAYLRRRDWSLNDAAVLAWDLAERARTEELLRRSRQGRWYFENGREEVFRWVTDLGASEVVGEMRDGELLRAEAPNPVGAADLNGPAEDGPR